MRHSGKNREPHGRGASRSRHRAAVVALLPALFCIGAFAHARAQLPAAPTAPPTGATLHDSLMTPADLAPADTSTATGPSIRKVSAVGFVNVDSLVVIRTFAVPTGQPYDAREVRAGVRRLFATGLFTDVTVSDAPVSGGVALTIHVAERPRVKEITFHGAKKIEEKTLKEKLTLAEGQLLDSGTLELDARKVETAYGAEGYAHAKVTTRVEPISAGAIRVVFDVQEGTKVKVRGVVFHGNHTLKSEDLAKAMESKKPGFLRSGVHKPEHLDKDETKLRLYMRTRGYKDADVDSIVPADVPDGKGVVLHVFLREGPRYRFGKLTWTGNTAVPTAALAFSTVPNPGTIYNEAQIQKTLENAYQLYQEQGYLFLSIDPKMSDRDSIVDVDFQVQEGTRSRIANLEITGNTRTRENVIRREASVYPGDVFRRSTLMRTQRDIFGLGYFQDVNVDYEPTGDSADINLTLKVQEKQTGTASAGAGYSSQTGLTGFVELGHNNLFGKGQSINIRVERGGKRSDLELSYTEPWFRDTPVSMGFDIFNTRRDLDFYRRKDVGGGIRIGRPLRWPDYTRGIISYDLRDVTLSDFVLARPGEPSNLQALRDTKWPRRVSSVTLTFNRNSTDNPFYPSKGSKIILMNEVAGGLLGGVESFYKETFENKTYTRLGGPFVLMVRGKTGFLGGGQVPDYERFRLGGTTSDYLRGYPDYYVVPRANVTRDSLTGQILDRYPGGKTMLILTSELQFPIADPLHGLLFFESGNTWNSTRDLDLGDLRKSIGFGVRLEVPALGRIGFDLGYGLDREDGSRWEPHFQLGNTF
ncbi:MAG TPA: outer membrane protein assembly factor BamA [Candidatus Dormibacteraeota bacterium]|nr:outer membrane protein assembly factor BamA [Candidatus Dormibacteraeota bacterium]